MIPIETGNGELFHYGTPGMKWGRRRYQNRDGSLTPLGRIRYGMGLEKKSPKNQNSKTPNKPSDRKDPDDTKASSKDFYQNRDKYTTNELNDIVKRKTAEKALRELMLYEANAAKGKSLRKVGTEFLKSFNETSKTASSIMENLQKGYKSYTEIKDRYKRRHSSP